MIYNYYIKTRDDPRNMILQYKDKEINFWENYQENRGVVYNHAIKFYVHWNSCDENNKIFSVCVSVDTSLCRNVKKLIQIKNVETIKIIVSQHNFTTLNKIKCAPVK